MPKFQESCKEEKINVAIRFRSRNPQVWQAAAPAYLARLTNDEVLQVVAAKAKTIKRSEREVLYQCIPERALLTPAAKPLRNCKPFEEHLQLLCQMLEAEENTGLVLDELTQRLNTEKKITNKALSYLRTIADQLPDELMPQPLRKVRRNKQESPLDLPFELRRFAVFEQYLEHLAGALEKNPKDPYLFEELILRIKSEKSIQLDNTLLFQRIADTLSDAQAVNFVNLVCKRNDRLKIALPEHCYFRPTADFLRKRLSNKERWELYDWGLSTSMAADQVDCILLKGDSKRAKRFWNIRVSRIKPGTRLFDLAPGSIQDDVLRRAYKIIVEEWRPRYKSVEFEPNKLISSLNSDDRRLASIWAGNRGKSSEINDRTMAITLSARIAEKAAKEFYENLGNQVIDVSIQQLWKTSNAWITHDLELYNGRKLDVKNARFSYKSQNSYVEHMIPKFKHARDGRPVQIVGVVSPFLKLSHFEGSPYQWENQTIVLGETSEKHIREQQGRFANTTSGLTVGELLPDRKDNKNTNTTRYHRRLPPWFFNYPESFYDLQRTKLNAIREMSDSDFPGVDILKRLGIKVPYPLLLAAGRQLPQQWRQTIPDWQNEFFETLMLSGAHRSLPVLFLSILSDFIARVQIQQEEFYPSNYRRLLFFETDKNTCHHPAGLFDPLSQIDNLCQNLVAVWRKLGPIKLRQFESFEFRGAGILRGFDKQDRKCKTLIAYCGGRTDQDVACGNTDLVLGKERITLCKVCGYLICPDCGRCSWSCEEKKKSEEYDIFAAAAN